MTAQAIDAYMLLMRMPTSAASMAQSIAKPLCIGLLLRFLQQPMNDTATAAVALQLLPNGGGLREG